MSQPIKPEYKGCLFLIAIALLGVFIYLTGDIIGSDYVRNLFYILPTLGGCYVGNTFFRTNQQKTISTPTWILILLICVILIITFTYLRESHQSIPNHI